MNDTEGTITSEVIKQAVPFIVNEDLESVNIPLSEWQTTELKNVSKSGVECLLHMWFQVQPRLELGSYCNATWDSFYCWPPILAGETITRPCSEILNKTEAFASEIEGLAIRICRSDGTWLWGDWTNYTVCADNYDKYITSMEAEDRDLVVLVRYILFIGSILSFLCLSTSLVIFYYFRCLRCDRVTVHSHLMFALTLRFAMLIVITEPFVLDRTNHYRNVDIICKIVLTLNMYATVASIQWMFIQGLYLHGKLTTNVFDKGTPFKLYYFVGWGLPLILITAWVVTMETYHPVHCWKDYSKLSYLWILAAPMTAALVLNFIFLINIMRILLTKIQRSNYTTDAQQFRRAVKATVVLFPLLGINNLLFLYNPGGSYKKTYVVLNTTFTALQGILVSILYCFITGDVREAIKREYRRFAIRRSANSIRRIPRKQRSPSNYVEGSDRLSFRDALKARNAGRKHWFSSRRPPGRHSIGRSSLNDTVGTSVYRSRTPSEYQVPTMSPNNNKHSARPSIEATDASPSSIRENDGFKELTCFHPLQIEIPLQDLNVSRNPIITNEDQELNEIKTHASASPTSRESVAETET